MTVADEATTTTPVVVVAPDGGVDLTPFVPRLVFDWEREAPDEIAREIEGSLLFVDLSGFTAMSERLAKLGRQGAEEVTEIISSTFAELLTEAYEVGGNLMKFGGDALLLFFRGEDHAPRAGFAASAMRTRLRALNPLMTPAGAVRLRMSAGIHSGAFQFFRVGSSHRELLVTGPGASATVAMEQEASAGQILLSTSAVAMMPQASVGALKGGGRLVRRAPVVAPTPAPRVPRRGFVDAASFLPVAVREHLREGGVTAEHRRATVAFVRFAGVGALLHDRGLVGAGLVFDELVRSTQEVVEEHGLCLIGTDIDADGGKLLIVGGLPNATEDHEERTLRAVRSIVPLDLPLRLSAGVHTGPVFAGCVGPSYRRSYTTMGDVVNTAARVMGKAAPGEVLATQPVLDRAVSTWLTSELPPFAVKGKSRPIVAWRVLAPRGRRDVWTPTAFEGRQQELARLTGLFEGVIGGSPAVVDIVGDIGVGKTELVDRARAAVPSLRSVSIRGDRYSSKVPFGMLSSWLRQRLQISGADVASARRAVREIAPDLEHSVPALAPLLGLSLSAPSEVDSVDPIRVRARAHGLAVELLLRVLEPERLLIVDDFQWLDAESAAVVRALARAIASTGSGAALVVCRRPDVEPIDHATCIELGPLADRDAASLIKTLSPHPLHLDQIERLRRRSGGNPMLIAELLRDFDPDQSELPPSLEAVIGQRLDRLRPRQRVFLRAASVLGDAFLVSDLEALCARPVDDDLAEVNDVLLVVGDTARFRHTLFRDLAYSALPYRMRTALHRRVAEQLESSPWDRPDRAALLAMHFAAAGEHAKAWRYSRMAADRANAAFADHEAAELLKLAAASARRVPTLQLRDVADVWVKLAESLTRSGRLEESAAPLARARALSRQDPEVLAAICAIEARRASDLGRASTAIRWARRGIRCLDGAPSTSAARDRVRLLLVCCQVRYRQGRYAEAWRVVNEALIEAEGAGYRAGVGQACNWLQILSTQLGRTDGSQHGRRALAIFEELDNTVMQVQVLNSLALDAQQSGRLEEALELFARVRSVASDLGEAMLAAIAANNEGEIHLGVGNHGAARLAYTEALEGFMASKHAYEHVVRANLAWVSAQEGDVEAALQGLSSARDALAAAGLDFLLPETDERIAAAREMRATAVP